LNKKYIYNIYINRNLKNEFKALLADIYSGWLRNLLQNSKKNASSLKYVGHKKQKSESGAQHEKNKLLEAYVLFLLTTEFRLLSASADRLLF